MVVASKAPLVFDASAIIALMKGEPGWELTRMLLRAVSVARMAHAVNLCEVYYHLVKLADEARVASELQSFAEGGLVTRRDLSFPFWRQVARLKADLLRVSLGDSFAIALAQEVGGEVVTADHGEFDLFAARGVCSVRFIR